MSNDHTTTYHCTYNRRRWQLRRRYIAIILIVAITGALLQIVSPSLGGFIVFLSILLVIPARAILIMNQKRPPLSWSERGIRWIYALTPNAKVDRALSPYCFIHWKNIANIALDPVTKNLTLTYS